MGSWLEFGPARVPRGKAFMHPEIRRRRADGKALANPWGSPRERGSGRIEGATAGRIGHVESSARAPSQSLLRKELSMKLARLLGASLMAIAAIATASSAEPVAYRLDPSHSEAVFSIRHVFSKVSGRFKELEGTIQYDEQNVANSSADITLKTGSIDTNNERRDADLRSANFFAADTFPTITFKCTKVIPGEKGNFKLVGDLNMHGVTKPVTLDVTLLGAGPF